MWIKTSKWLLFLYLFFYFLQNMFFCSQINTYFVLCFVCDCGYFLSLFLCRYINPWELSFVFKFHAYQSISSYSTPKLCQGKPTYCNPIVILLQLSSFHLKVVCHLLLCRINVLSVKKCAALTSTVKTLQLWTNLLSLHTHMPWRHIFFPVMS